MPSIRTSLLAAGVGVLTPFAMVTGAQANADTCATFTTSPRCFFVESDPSNGLRVTKVDVESNSPLRSYVRFVGVQPDGTSKDSAVFVIPGQGRFNVCNTTSASRLPCGLWQDGTTLKMQSVVQNAHGGWTYTDISRQSVEINK